MELIVHFQCDTSKKTLPVSPEIEKPGKSRGRGWYALECCLCCGSELAIEIKTSSGRDQDLAGCGSELPRLEGVAACNLPRPQPGHEPARALF